MSDTELIYITRFDPNAPTVAGNEGKGETVSEKFLRLIEVQRRVPYSRSTIYLKVSRGEFPHPISLGARAVGWLESDIDEWMAQRIDRSRERASA